MANTGSGTGVPIESPEVVSVAGPDHSGTSLALDEFRRLMLAQVNPWHFWQLADNDKVPMKLGCSRLMYQHSWREPNSIGRDEIVAAIKSAEAKLADVLGYWPGERYESDELLYGQPFQTTWAKVKAVGVLKWERLNDIAPEFIDTDGDGLKETFTLTLPVGFTDPSQIAVFFGAADRLGEDVSLKWQVRPVSVKISGGDAIITGKVWSIVHPGLYERLDKNMIDPTAEASFASSLDVYRLTLDTTNQGGFTWLNMPSGCCDDSNDPSGQLFKTAYFQVRDSEKGSLLGSLATFADGQWTGDEWPYCTRPYAPTNVSVNYLTGGPFTDHMKLMVARLTAAEIGRSICGCENMQTELERWQVDLSLQPEEGDSYSFSQNDIDENPWGMRTGHVWTFREAKRHAVMHGISLG